MCCNDSPDYSGMNRAAEANADIAKQALSWYQDAYREQAPLRERAANRADEISLAQLDAMRKNTALADQYQEERKPYTGAEQIQLSKALNFDTEAEREKRAGAAAADVAAAFDGTRGQLVRDMGRYGVNASGDAIALGLKELGAREALATAGAKNKARRDSETVGRAMLADAINTGRNLPSNQATSAQIALGAGDRAAATGQVPISLAQGATSMAGQGFNTAIAGNSSAGNIYGQVASLQQREGDNSGLWGALGQVGGGFAGSAKGSAAIASIFSDEDMKEGKKPHDEKVSLAAVRKMPVKEWRYKKGSAGDDGGKPHVGPMAQAVRLAAGEKAAPGGKTIDVVNMHGVTLAAVRQLDRNVQKLEKKVISLANARRPEKKRA